MLLLRDSRVAALLDTRLPAVGLVAEWKGFHGIVSILIYYVITDLSSVFRSFCGRCIQYDARRILSTSANASSIRAILETIDPVAVFPCVLGAEGSYLGALVRSIEGTASPFSAELLWDWGHHQSSPASAFTDIWAEFRAARHIVSTFSPLIVATP